MARQVNKHGLSRDIPADVKRQVRKACGFGCVMCGLSICDYEHVDPPYSEAKEHDPSAITLLCPQCHAKVTRGFLSKDTVKSAMMDPFCKRKGFANEFFDLGKTHPSIIFAGVTLRNCPIPIEFRGIPLFEIKEGEEPGAPFRLSATFYNTRGEQSLKIVDNEWQVAGWNWDVEVTGGSIVIRDRPRHVSLQLKAAPPNGIIVERMDMYILGTRFIGNDEKLEIVRENGSVMTLAGCLIDNCRIGLSIG